MNPIPVPFILTISLQQLHSILLQLFLITIRVLMSIYLLILFRPIWSVLIVLPLNTSIRLYTAAIAELFPPSFTLSASDSESDWSALLTLSDETYIPYAWKQCSLLPLYSNLSNSLSIQFTPHLMLLSMNFNSWFGTRMMRLLLSLTQFTLSSDWDWIPLSATSIIFESNSFGDMVNVDLSNFISLQSVVFREGSFASAIVLRITGNHHSII